MATTSLSPTPKLQFFDLNGAPLSGGLLYTYEAGSTTPLATYTDSTGLIANTNPIVLDSRGEANVWLSGANYKIALYTSAGALIWTVDNISINASQVVYDPAGTGAVQTTVQAKLRQFVTRSDYDSQANYEVARDGYFGTDSDARAWTTHYVAGYKPFGNSGDTFPGAPAKRDGFTVSRELLGGTDCHAYSDKTVIDQVTDYGGYGTFDATTILRGSHTHNHVFAYQDRVLYEGSGVLENQKGFYCRPEMTGSGTMNSRMGAHIYDIAKSGAGTVLEQNGVQIDDLSAANINVALHLKQTTGYGIYAPGGAQSYHLGKFSIGFDNTAFNYGAILAAKNTSGKTWFVETDSANVFSGIADGDGNVKTVIGNNVRFGVYGLADNYCVAPGADNTQSLGTVSLRWSVVYAGTGTINTSDGREKQQVAELTSAEKVVAQKVKSLIRTFKFNDAVEKKGDGARVHVGAIAQDVQSAFQSEGLDPAKYGIFCYDEWAEDSEEVEAVEGEEGAYAKSVEVAKTETITVNKTKIEIVGDRAVSVSYAEEIKKEIYRSVPLFDEQGNRMKELVSPAAPASYDADGTLVEDAKDAVFRDAVHQTPVMETVIKYYKKKINRKAGNLYGLRYEELLAFIIAAM